MARPRQVTDAQILTAARQLFLNRGTGVTVADIAAELGVSHTTVFNRFGAKEDLMIAALSPPEQVAWVATLNIGPDPARPICEQLIELAHMMSLYFQELQAGMSVLNAAGIGPERVWENCAGEPSSVQAFRAFCDWLQRAEVQGRLVATDRVALASAIVGVVHHRTFSEQLCPVQLSVEERNLQIAQFITMLWQGIRPIATESSGLSDTPPRTGAE
jgi:AcrR family transcriptional regulator